MARTSGPIRWHVGPKGPEQCKAQPGNCPFGRHLEGQHVNMGLFESAASLTAFDVRFYRGYTLEDTMMKAREKANQFYLENGFYPDGWEVTLSGGTVGMVSHFSPTDPNLPGFESGENGLDDVDGINMIAMRRESHLLTVTYMDVNYQSRVIRLEPRFYDEAAFDALAQDKAERVLRWWVQSSKKNLEGTANLSRERLYIADSIKDYYRGTALSLSAAIEPDKANEMARSLGILKNSINYGDLASLDVNVDYTRANVSDFFRFNPDDNLMYCETEATFRSGGRDKYHYAAPRDTNVEELMRSDPYTLKRFPDGRWMAEVNGQKMTMNTDTDMKAYILSHHHTLFQSEKVIQFIDRMYSPQARHHDTVMYERRKAVAVEGSPRPVCLNPLFEKFGYYRPESETDVKSKLFSFLRGGKR